MNAHDRRFDAVRSRTSIDDERDATAQLVKDVLSRRRTDSAEPIRARRGQRRAERANDFDKHRVRAYSNGHRVQAGGYDVRHDCFARQDNREGTRPKCFGKLRDQLSILRCRLRDFFEPIAIRKMNDQGIEARSAFGVENFCDGY